MIETKRIEKVIPELTEFIEECKRRAYKNNNSLHAMRFHKILDENGAWYGTFDNNRIVGLSGVHQFKDGYRALFRGCQLHSMPGGLSKNHMNCWMFYYHLPKVIDAAGGDPIYITTNIDNDASGKMLKLDRLYHILQSKSIVSHKGVELLYGVDQNIWQLNEDVYFEARGNAKW
jgi:hypothetical protein